MGESPLLAPLGMKLTDPTHHLVLAGNAGRATWVQSRMLCRFKSQRMASHQATHIRLHIKEIRQLIKRNFVYLVVQIDRVLIVNATKKKDRFLSHY